jgi:hypothetical protein
MPDRKLAGVFMRFTIRDVLWLTVVLSMGMGWWVQIRNKHIVIDAFLTTSRRQTRELNSVQKELNGLKKAMTERAKWEPVHPESPAHSPAPLNCQ